MYFKIYWYIYILTDLVRNLNPDKQDVCHEFDISF